MGISIQQIEQGFHAGAGAYQTRPFNRIGRMMGSNMGRNAFGAGLGIVALGQAGNMAQRLRYRDYQGAAVSAGVAGAAGYGAYMTLMQREAMTTHLKTAANFAAKNGAGLKAAAGILFK